MFLHKKIDFLKYKKYKM